jgi:hypothetical protein
VLGQVEKTKPSQSRIIDNWTWELYRQSSDKPGVLYLKKH